ncbi:MCP four helix bundle domain-containing protein [Hymenobacter artigasi]|uniref:Anion-transporting ArsA/GET3 family ATPase n=1 Tax=Hymenobacter artigasi TaxID=2719616 RepID=A0ABX1HKZ6_9BACT|nr:MCP four helix bundle domain-containing protein [Hymenobacter artigasi]NKI90931.1 anion-transporting ArsA/GET3 family ATPase [Hymenobacter artigasi]
MNMLSRIHDKARPIGLFLLVMLVILGSSMVERRLMNNVTTSLSSLYQDRLLPATGLFELNNLLYTKQQLLTTYEAAPAMERRRTLKLLAGYNQQLAAIIKQHQATYLVRQEKEVLQAFQVRLNRYNALEAQLLATDAPPTAGQVAEAARQIQQLHAGLSQLNQIQQRVGQQLSQSSQVTEGNSQLLSNVTIAMLLVFTLAIQHALLSSRHPLVPKNLQNFRLN